jgi:anthranilate phosphoribosyltransferase
MIRDAIRHVVEGEHLSEAQAADAMTEIMDGEATSAQIASLITALRIKGETVEEITGFVRVMREKSLKVVTSREPLVDTCGTGGGKLKTFNISTAAAFVVAGAGVAVAKHGNRAASSKCGSADVLEAMGINIALPPDVVGRCIDECGIGFLFAPSLHPAMKHAVGPRKEIGIRTVFNILGPMTNPAGAKYQLIGVFAPHLCELMANVLAKLGSKRAMVVHGIDGIDECSTFGETLVAEVSQGQSTLCDLHPSYFGCPKTTIDALAAGESPEDHAKTLINILYGEKGPKRDIVLANAGAALYVTGLARDLREGTALAAESIDSGAARETFENLKKFTEGTG